MEGRREGGGTARSPPSDGQIPAACFSRCCPAQLSLRVLPSTPTGGISQEYPGLGIPVHPPALKWVSPAVSLHKERVWGTRCPPHERAVGSGAGPALTLLQSGRPGWVLVRSPVMESLCSLAASRSRAICSPIAFMSFLLRADVMYMCISKNGSGCSSGARLQTGGPAPRHAPSGQGGLCGG